MRMNTYLTFDGCCRSAFEFYRSCLGGEIVAMMTFADMPACDDLPADARNRIMHARLVVNDQVLMGSDTMPAHPYQGINGAQIAINVDTPEEAEQMFGALSVNGSVSMPLDETFWAVRFGMFVDQFGVPWMVNCEKEK